MCNAVSAVRCAICNVQHAMLNVQFAMIKVQCALCNDQCTMCSVQCSVNYAAASFCDKEPVVPIKELAAPLLCPLQ